MIPDFYTRSLNPDKHQQNKGFTTVELIMTVGVMAVLVGTAVPDISRLIARNAVDATTSNLRASLSAARSYAINQHKIVHVCARLNAQQIKCDRSRQFNANWSNGWLIYTDINANNELDDQDTVLQSSDSSTRTNIVFNQRGRLRFFPDGSARSAGFYVCDKASNSHKHILLLHTGRSRTRHTLTARQQKICDTI